MKIISELKGLFYVIITVALFSCEKNDYIIGGEINESNRVEKTTFDFLASFEVTTETAELLEYAGLKDHVNGDVTFIAPSNFAVRRYLRRLNNKALRINPDTSEIKINDLHSDSLANQLKMYFVDGVFSREEIPEQGLYMETHGGDSIRLTVEEANTDPIAAYDGGGTPGSGYQYGNFMQELPKLVYVHFKRGENWELNDQLRNSIDPDGTDGSERDFEYRMYVSDIVTTTGVVHVIYAGDKNFTNINHYHTLFFYGTTNDDKL